MAILLPEAHRVNVMVMLQAPLFGMQSWVNSSEVRKWLQSQIADPQTLRSAATAASSSGQDALYPNPNAMSRHGSESHIPPDAAARSGSMADAPWVCIAFQKLQNYL